MHREEEPLDDPLGSRDSLPPVESPSAGFIVQLFVVPGVIVGIIVAVTLLFNWLAHMGRDPQDYLERIRAGRLGAWQAAHDLATELAQDRGLRRNASLAERTHALLLAKLEEPPPPKRDEQRENILVYLAAALGAFEKGDVIPALLKAAGTAYEGSLSLQASAVESLAMLAGSRDEPFRKEHPEVVSTLIALTDSDRDPRLQARAAFALGIWGGPEAQSRLQDLLSRGQEEVRCNAATGLARHALDAATLAATRQVLAEMLALQNGPSFSSTAEREEWEARQFLLLKNGMAATAILRQNNPTADLSELREAVTRVHQAARRGELPHGSAMSLELLAAETLRLLENPAAQVP